MQINFYLINSLYAIGVIEKLIVLYLGSNFNLVKIK